MVELPEMLYHLSLTSLFHRNAQINTGTKSAGAQVTAWYEDEPGNLSEETSDKTVVDVALKQVRFAKPGLWCVRSLRSSLVWVDALRIEHWSNGARVGPFPLQPAFVFRIPWPVSPKPSSSPLQGRMVWRPWTTLSLTRSLRPTTATSIFPTSPSRMRDS